MNTKKCKPTRGLLRTLAPLTVVLAGVCVLFSSIGRLNAQVITNGSFESPVLAANDWQAMNAPSDTSITGWNVVSGTTGAAGLFNGTPITSILGPQNGNQYLYLSGGDFSGQPAVYAEQVVSGFTIGNSYTLSFYAGDPQRDASNAGFFSATVGSTVIIPHATYVGADSPWVLYSGTFTATATSQTVRIESNGADFGNQVGIDNVVITVPEPGSTSLAILGLLAVGGVLYGRRFRRSMAA